MRTATPLIALCAVGWLAVGAHASLPVVPEIPPALASDVNLANERSTLLTQLAGLQSDGRDFNRRCGDVVVNTPEEQACARDEAAINARIEAYRAAVARFREKLASLANNQRSYRYSGSALVGGTSWIVGYNVPPGSKAALRKQATDMLRRQAQLAGLSFEAIDLDRYDFVIGIAASTNVIKDLGLRVVFDELSKGQFSATHQALYNALIGRRFDELACHSNGAMVCLAALSNQAIKADHVRLYGPQLTADGLNAWADLVAKGRIRSVEVFVNQGDPVPAVSLLLGSNGSAQEPDAPLLFSAKAVSDYIRGTADGIAVHVAPCAKGVMPDFSCHAMTKYRQNFNANRQLRSMRELSAPQSANTVEGR